MELLNLLRQNNLSDFSDIKQFLTNKPYKLLVKEDPKYTNLYMVTYNNETSNMTNSLVRKCRGLVLEKGTNKLLCYTFNKMGELNGDELNNMNLDWSNVKVEEAIDGTQIRLFYYQDSWLVSTTRCIDAYRARWHSKKTFGEMFDECKFNFDELNKNYCYSYVLCHPENRIVTPYETPTLYHVLTRDMSNANYPELDQRVGNEVTKYDFNSTDALLDSLKSLNNDNGELKEGFILNVNGERYKLQSDTYKQFKYLRGNVNNMFFRYLQLRYEGLKDKYLEIYPENRDRFMLYDIDFKNLAKTIQHQYMERHVLHTRQSVDEQFKVMIYRLHGLYISNHEKTTVNKVIQELDKLDPKIVCKMYNETFEPHHPYHAYMN